MRTNGLVLIVTLCLIACTQEPAPPAPAPKPPPPRAPSRDYPKQETSIDRAFAFADFQNLEEEIVEYVSKGTRDVDGVPKLYKLEKDFQEFLELPGNDKFYASPRLAVWEEKYPESAYRPIVQAIALHASAWNARGNGYASTVTPEGWKLFGELNQQAWQMLMDNKEKSSRIPSWYTRAISTGLDTGASPADLLALFDEGIARHPRYFPIYFSYMRPLTPRWGGSYKAIDRFIREQVDSKNNTEGDQLYARLYWMFDDYDGREPTLFEQSSMDWRRMRKGFDEMMQAYPNSEWNRGSFASFACRARDAATYARLRPKVQEVSFWNASPEGFSLAVCDARFMKKT